MVSVIVIGSICVQNCLFFFKMGQTSSALADPEYNHDSNLGLSENKVKSVNEKMGIPLVKHCIKTLAQKDVYIADFFDFEKHTTTKSILTKDSEEKTWKEFTTVFDGSQTIIVVNYKVPCDVRVEKYMLNFDWHATHSGNKLQFNWHGNGTTELSNMFMLSQGE